MKFAVVLAALVAVAIAAPVDDPRAAQIVRLESDNIGTDGYKFAWVIKFLIKQFQLSRQWIQDGYTKDGSETLAPKYAVLWILSEIVMLYWLLTQLVILDASDSWSSRI